MKSQQYTINKGLLIDAILRSKMTTSDWKDYLNYQGPVFYKKKYYKEFPE